MLGHSTISALSSTCGLSLLLGSTAIGCSKPPGADDGAAKQGSTPTSAPQGPKEGAEIAAPRPLAAPPPTAAATSRALTFTNQCPFDVWVQSVGSNAANIPCSAVTTSAQANCPSGSICYDANVNTQYCVPGTTQSNQFPVTSQSAITLDASQCPSGQLVTDTSSNLWGQCTCSTNSDCGSNQICGPVAKGLDQCFWGYELAQGGKLTPPTGGANVETITIDASSTVANAIIASGNFFAQLSCDVNGNCLSDSDTGSPATRIEYTLVNGNDFYDVSYINGMNVPAVMTPVTSTSLDYQSNDPYRCMAAGGDARTMQAIASFQQQNGIAGNTELQAFACTNDYDSTYVDELVGLNFVDPPPASPTTCKASADCSDGDVCGLSLGAVTGQSGVTLGQLTCGQRLGYWTYTQLCAANSSFASTALGVNCSDAQTRAYAECTSLQGVSDQGPGRSCFNSNTTTNGDTCCGYEAWSFGGKSQPLALGSSAVDGAVTTFWTTNILPLVKTVKAGCPLAYSYQFDDPFSTFTCATEGSPNTVSYDITLCPNGDAAGIDPPPPPTCTATVPPGNDANELTVGIPAGISIVVDSCDATGNTSTTPLSPTAGTNIFTTTGATLYQITATNAESEQQSCQFTIPASGCITRAGSSSQPPCSLWVVDTTGAWAGRSIAIPSF
jgi:hypothetical protein